MSFKCQQLTTSLSKMYENTLASITFRYHFHTKKTTSCLESISVPRLCMMMGHIYWKILNNVLYGQPHTKFHVNLEEEVGHVPYCAPVCASSCLKVYTNLTQALITSDRVARFLTIIDYQIDLISTFVTRCYLVISKAIFIVKSNTRLQESMKIKLKYSYLLIGLPDC